MHDKINIEHQLKTKVKPFKYLSSDFYPLIIKINPDLSLTLFSNNRY
jgi:hypothetical protein